MAAPRTLAALLSTALALPPLPAMAGAATGPSMLTDASNAVLPAARNNFGSAGGSGLNVVKDYGADPTGVADSTTAFQNAVNAACNSLASPPVAERKVYVPPGYYNLSPITITGKEGCWIAGHGEDFLFPDDGGTYILSNPGVTSGDLFQFRGLGQFRLSDMRIDAAGVFAGGASYARVHAGGANYAVNNTITLTGGTFTAPTVLKVTSVGSGGAVTGAVISTPGTYSVAPSPVAPVAQGTTSGSGSGATFDVVYANSAAIAISGPTTRLTADAAAGATSLTVASIANFTMGAQINIEQDNGKYFATTVAATPSGSSITLVAGLPFKASANHPVYGVYAMKPIIENVICSGYWDCLRVENAAFVKTEGFVALNYYHDGIIKINGAYPDAGGDFYRGLAWDFNLGTSSAGIEILSGGAVTIGHGSAFQWSNYSVLLNSYFGPTGTLLLAGTSFEDPKICAVRLHQSVNGVEYANVDIIGSEFSNIANTASQHFCVDAGIPNTSPKWIRNIVFADNHSNDYITGALPLVSVQDGDNIVIAGNALNNNNAAGPTAISIGGAATHASEYGNTIAGFPSGAYGTMQDSSLSRITAHGGVAVPFNTPALQTGLVIDNADLGGNGSQIDFRQNGASVNQIVSSYGGHWYLRFRYNNGDILTLQDNNLATFSGPVIGQIYHVTKTANYTVTSGDSGTHFDNIGAAGEVDFTLPPAAPGLNYCFLVDAAQTVKVIAATGDKIAIGTATSVAGGNVTATASYASVCLEAHKAAQWAARATTASWTVN